jgi:hypothetical protein
MRAVLEAPDTAAKKLARDESIYIIPIEIVCRMSQGQSTTFEGLGRRLTSTAFYPSLLRDNG